MSHVEGITCPSCHAFIALKGKATEAESESLGRVTERQVKELLDFKEVEVELTPSEALVRLIGRFSQKKFQKLSSEAQEFGGTYVKGHFRIPLSNLLGSEKQ